jgi:uncharacterized membrane protein YqjE
MAEGTSRAAGLLDSIARLARTAVGVLRTRIELLATELEEERLRFSQLVLAVTAVVFCLQLTVLLAVTLIVVLAWQAQRLWILGALVALFLIAGLAGIAYVRHLVRTRPRLFSATVAELAKDEEHLGGGAP